MGFSIADLAGIVGVGAGIATGNPSLIAAGFGGLSIGRGIAARGDQLAAIEEARNLIQARYEEAADILTAAHAGIGAGVEGAEKALKSARAAAIRAITQGKEEAQQTLKEGKVEALAYLERFWAEADQALSPFIEHGLLAQKEVGSMLGIPGYGMYDIEKLRNTPGYQFIQTEAMNSVIRSQIGNKLSTAGQERLEAVSGGIAEQYFQSRVDDLQQEADRGGQAAGLKAQLAEAFGRTGAAGVIIPAAQSEAGVQFGSGVRIGEVETATGAGIAEARLAGAEAEQRLDLARAALIGHVADAEAGLLVGGGNARAGFNTGLSNLFAGVTGNILGDLDLGSIFKRGSGDPSSSGQDPVGILETTDFENEFGVGRLGRLA